MDAPDFETVRSVLRKAGFREAEARYDEGAFGSWRILLNDPPARIVWDGKERSLAVQQGVGDAWADAWVARAERDQTADAVARQLTLLRGHS